MENYEQKYKEALVAAKDLIKTNPSDLGLRAWAEDVFPELGESEDERIRKGLLSYVNMVKAEATARFPKEDILLEDIKIDDAIAWLEKQGEQSNNEEAEKEKDDYVTGQFLYCKGSFNEFKEGESYWLEYVGNDNYIGRSDNILNQKFHITPKLLYTWLDPRHDENNNAEVEKQGEKKPDKIQTEYERGFNDAIDKVRSVIKETDFCTYYNKEFTDWFFKKMKTDL